MQKRLLLIKPHSSSLERKMLSAPSDPVAAVTLQTPPNSLLFSAGVCAYIYVCVLNLLSCCSQQRRCDHKLARVLSLSRWCVLFSVCWGNKTLWAAEVLHFVRSRHILASPLALSGKHHANQLWFTCPSLYHGAPFPRKQLSDRGVGVCGGVSSSDNEAVLFGIIWDLM